MFTADISTDMENFKVGSSTDGEVFTAGIPTDGEFFLLGSSIDGDVLTTGISTDLCRTFFHLGHTS